MAERPVDDREPLRRWSVAALVAWGFALRAIAAVQVEAIARRRETLCLFDDTNIYWGLGGAIRTGAPYAVPQWGGIPHYTLRTPGYPLFLAACQWAFGASNTLAARLVQAALGAVCVWLVARLVARVGPERARWAPVVAALLVASDPYTVGMAALLLSEALFVPLMLLALLGLARLWGGTGRPRLVALGTGVAAGAAILTKPSWALCPPALLAVWIFTAGKGRRGAALRGAAVVMLGVAVAMAPWWVRNARVVGRFVPTALWLGASLYDGLNPGATGASDMAFLNAPDVRGLSEPAQDAELTRRALAFVAAEPGRALELAAIKAGRFWSPWPNAETLRDPRVIALGAAVALPVFAAIALGARDRRRDARALAILGGPLLYAAALHLVFVGSIRYRIPAEVPALGLAAIGLARLVGRRAEPPR